MSAEGCDITCEANLESFLDYLESSIVESREQLNLTGVLSAGTWDELREAIQSCGADVDDAAGPGDLVKELVRRRKRYESLYAEACRQARMAIRAGFAFEGCTPATETAFVAAYPEPSTYGEMIIDLRLAEQTTRTIALRAN
jgi:hypothetical protein